MKNIKQLKTTALFLVMILCSLCFTKDIKAATGSVYSCQIARTYEHPVSGKVEDSGGSSSKATGQGMVEGVIASKGLLEVTNTNEYYLTFRMSLIDQTSNYQFGVQKRGGSSFQTQSVTQTASGKDKNGTTKDFRIKLPSQDSIIRCSMYVKPMGRNVIFYFYPGNYTQGNTVGMKAKIVIGEASTKQTSKQEDTTEATTQATTETQTQTSTQTQQTQSQSDESLDDAQGLSLSTAPKTTKTKSSSSERSVGTWIFILTVSMTLSGLILLGVAAGIVYYYRKNWNRWSDDQDEYDEIYNDEN